MTVYLSSALAIPEQAGKYLVAKAIRRGQQDARPIAREIAVHEPENHARRRAVHTRKLDP